MKNYEEVKWRDLSLPQELSWLIHAYAISRVKKIKCRVKWTNKSWPGGNIGGVISEKLEKTFQMMKKMTHIINWINYHECEHDECKCKDWIKTSTISVDMGSWKDKEERKSISVHPS